MSPATPGPPSPIASAAASGTPPRGWTASVVCASFPPVSPPPSRVSVHSRLPSFNACQQPTTLRTHPTQSENTLRTHPTQLETAGFG
eukprot:1838758-Pyramimonas_sp.AAC.1